MNSGFVYMDILMNNILMMRYQFSFIEIFVLLNCYIINI